MLEYYILTTSKFIEGPVVVTVCTHDESSAATLGNQVIGKMTQYPTQSEYSVTEPASSCSILIMQSAWLRSDRYKFLIYWFDSTRVRTRGFESFDLPKWETDAQRMRPPGWYPHPGRDHSGSVDS